jgi:hypothetical protein
MCGHGGHELAKHTGHTGTVRAVTWCERLGPAHLVSGGAGMTPEGLRFTVYGLGLQFTVYGLLSHTRGVGLCWYTQRGSFGAGARGGLG